MVKVGYLGPKGTFSEEATYRYFFEQRDVQLVALQTIMDVLEEVKSGNLDQGVVPIENSIEGSINTTVDSLAESKNLFVQGEIVLNVSQHLLVNKGTKLEDIREVWSIPPAIAQCRNFIQNLKAHVKNFDSTAAAALALKNSGQKDAGAIASAWAARQMDLDILTSDIQEYPINHTRFVVVTKDQQPPESAQKTMLLIVPSRDYSGMLVNILNVFATLNLNLTWIESRPTKRRLGTYQFYLDIEAGLGDDSLSKALSILEIIGHEVRVMGSFNTTRLQS